MRRRTIWIVVSVAVVVVAIVAAFLLRKRAAPEPARLLPEAEAYLYLNLKPLRSAGIIGNKPLPMAESDYADFVKQTGFQFERDLDDAAFAIHAAPRLMDVEPSPSRPEAFRRYSEIFRGRFDSQRAAAYFKKIAKSSENYREVDIYNIPLEGRTVRVALLGVGIAAVSNTDGPQAIHYMVDRYKETALPFGGPTLVRQYYRRVPLGSLVWGIARVTNEGGKGSPLVLPGGFDLLFPSNAVVVGSVRYLTDVQVRAEAFTASPEQAKQIADQADAFLSIFHGLENSMNPGGSDPDVKAFFDSLKVQTYKNRALLSAEISTAFLKKLFAEPPTEAITAPSTPAPEQQPKKKALGERKHKSR